MDCLFIADVLEDGLTLVDSVENASLEIACFEKEFIGEDYAIAKADGNMHTDANIQQTWHFSP